ncbi:hypothetical protein BD310DRAFT_711851 [Dichomitus squalens]|uniref:Uncharacterized protein n=1 Tax=Dichomitus squalens TaxID=114155 RepID=A0A4Q9PLJ6_9APHY|nr:hypothetical protein BD310DRAFT_711851 [Dichomitus squalens]
MTWFAIGRRAGMKAVIKTPQGSLSSVMLRDGMIYFVADASGDHSHTPFGSIVTSINTSISVVMVSHFLLDLQEANQRTVKVILKILYILREALLVVRSISCVGWWIPWVQS